LTEILTDTLRRYCTHAADEAQNVVIAAEAANLFTRLSLSEQNERLHFSKHRVASLLPFPRFTKEHCDFLGERQ
jgi:hypothetical protein